MTKRQPTAEQLRAYIVDVLQKREGVCRAAGLNEKRSSKTRQWEIGRADGYKDFRAFLLELDLTKI